MKRVRRVGFFAELPYGEKDGATLQGSVGKLGRESIERIAQYLEAGVLLIGSPGFTRDVLAKDRAIIGSSGILTDGEWAWHRDLAFYVKKYAVELPPEFVEHMVRNGWAIQSVDVNGIEF